MHFSTPGSYVAICDSCNTAIGRADFANLGKVGDMAVSESPLQLGLRGSVGGNAFELVGHTQRRNSAGATWEEWYVHFAKGDRWGWLSEAQGAFFLLFAQTLAQPLRAADVQLGARVDLEGQAFSVHEVGEASTTAAAGELPFAWAPQQIEPYADATGPGDTFATLQPQSLQEIYLGRAMTLQALGLAQAPAAARAAKPVASRRLACPQCGGGLELFAPDRAEHLGCPHCGALLDVRSEVAQIIHASHSSPGQPWIPLGSVGKFGTVAYRVLGMIRRATTSDGETYTWDEYLLYERVTGYRWLVRAQGHWSFVEPVPAESVQVTAKTAVHGHETFKLYGRCAARITRVLGEFYWPVCVGQSCVMDDYISPPFMLSREQDDHEIVWSQGLYLAHETVQRAFKDLMVSKPEGVGAHQPWPHRGVFKAAMALTVVAYMLKWTLGAGMVQSGAFTEEVPVSAAAQTQFSARFLLESGHNVAVTVAAAGSLGWVHVDGDLVEEDSGTVLSWSADLSEGDGDEPSALGEETVWLSAPPSGTYTLRTETVGSGNVPATISVQQGVPNADAVLHFAIFNMVVLAGFLLHKLSFENTRWQNSDVGDT